MTHDFSYDDDWGDDEDSSSPVRNRHTAEERAAWLRDASDPGTSFDRLVQVAWEAMDYAWPLEHRRDVARALLANPALGLLVFERPHDWATIDGRARVQLARPPRTLESMRALVAELKAVPTEDSLGRWAQWLAELHERHADPVVAERSERAVGEVHP